MTQGEGDVDDCGRHGFPVAGFGSENYVPHAHDRWTFIFIANRRRTGAPPICGFHAAGFESFVGIPHSARALGIIAQAITRRLEPVPPPNRYPAWIGLTSFRRTRYHRHQAATQFVSTFDQALLCAQLGNRERTFDFIEESFRMHSQAPPRRSGRKVKRW